MLELRQGDMRDPPVEGEFPLIAIPFRSLLHMETEDDRRAAFRAVARHLTPTGRLVFDVFAPGADDIADTHGRWLEREPGIWERADWHEDTRTLILRLRSADGETEMSLAWLSVSEWKELLREEGFVVDAPEGGVTVPVRLDVELDVVARPQREVRAREDVVDDRSVRIGLRIRWRLGEDRRRAEEDVRAAHELAARVLDADPHLDRRVP